MPRPHPTSPTKRCSCCGTEKLRVSEFRPRPSRNSVVSHCRQCEQKTRKARYQPRPRKPIRTPILSGDVITIQLTHGQTTVIDVEDAELARLPWYAQRAGKTRDRWYAVHRSGSPAKTLYMHREVAKRAGMQIDGMEVDHIDVDELNNRRGNLRPASPQQNQSNKGKSQRNKSGYKGVSWSARARKWKAYISVTNKTIALGEFSDPESAAEAYAAGAARFHGAFARTEVDRTVEHA